MEIILAIVVGVAVIFFGALISMGNERQRKAIDSLREQTALWAVQDLKIKRERLAREAKVTDPFAWFNKVAAKVYGLDLKLQFLESFDQPQGLIFTSGYDGSKFIFSTLSQKEINSLGNAKRGRLSQLSDQNPLLSLPRGIKSYELSVLNCDVLFDLELPIAWKGLSGQYLGETGHIWMYQVS
jgi:hypothetical protein